MNTQNAQDLRLFCEYQSAPLAVETEHPRFSWRREGTGTQAAYRVRVFAAPLPANTLGPCCWDSGLVRSVQNADVRYNGAPLRGRSRYAWQLELHETDGAVYTSAPVFFETGIPEGMWRGQWIGAPVHTPGVTDLLRQTVRLTQKPAAARLYIAGVGLYEAFLNGKKTDDRVLEPAWTDYRHRVLYSVYDVTELLDAGENVLGVELAEGWYGHNHPSFDRFMGHQPAWLGTPALRYELLIIETDGTETYWVSEPGGMETAAGAVTENSIYDGEVYDARREKPGWCVPGASSEEWQKAVATVGPAGRLVAQQMPPIRVFERRHLTVSPAGTTPLVLDAQQNMAGWLSVTVSGTAGSRVELRYGETLHPDGTVNQENLRGARSRDVYFLRGSGTETWHARFTYHGFRYVQVLLDGNVTLLAAEAQAICSDVVQTGRFVSSQSLLNRCMRAMLWTERSNMPGLPTDCPQRDERMAWLNDVTVRCEEALYNFDLRLFYEKWLEDIADAQAPCGSLPDTAPHVYCGNPSFHISSCYVLIPWFLYRYYGDKTVLERHYEGMKRYVRFLASQRDGEGVIGAPYFGEWAPPAAECDQSSP